MGLRDTHGYAIHTALLLALTAVLIAWPSQARGQPTAAPEPPPRLEASAQFSFLSTRGNADSQSLGAGGDLVWRPSAWTHTAKVVFARTESEGEVSARSLASLFRASRALNTRLSAYGQYDFLRDVFAGVEQRHVLEAGASYLAVETAPHRLRLDAAVGYLYEEQLAGHFDSMTLSLAGLYRLEMSSTSALAYEPRFLLPLADTDAWKFDQNVALTVGINTILSLKVAHTLRYSADPPEGFDTTDTIMAVSLVAKVRRPR